jgi:uncharacterized protein (TIGR02147 family)
MVGFTNKGFIFNIIKGKRKLSKLHCYKFSKALHHTKEEADYFENIVAYSLATNDEERDYYYGQALRCKSGAVAPAYQLRKDQYEFYSKWYHSAIRALINLQPFKDDFRQLCQRLSPPITKKQAQQSVQLLDRLGLIARGDDGIYRMTKTKIKTGDEISPTAKNRFHFQCTELATNSIMNHSPLPRNVTSLTLGISERTYEMICKEEQQFKERISELASSDKKADRVYQYQLLLFPLTHNEAPK